DAGLVADDLAGGHAADRYLALARAEILDCEARYITADVLDALRVRTLNILLRLRIDRERHVLHGRRALGRGDDDVPFLGSRHRRCLRIWIDGLRRRFLPRLCGCRNRDCQSRTSDEQCCYGAHADPQCCCCRIIMPEICAMAEVRCSATATVRVPTVALLLQVQNGYRANGSNSRGGTSGQPRSARKRCRTISACCSIP